MAERSRRSSVNLAVDTSQKVGPAQPVAHEIPQFVGSMRGVDPWAGDMSAAFNQFFGSINQSLNTVMDAQRGAEIIKVKGQREQMKAAANAQATTDYESRKASGQKLDLSTMNPTPLPTTVTADGAVLQTSEWKAYGHSYSQATGRLNGNRLYNNMIEEAAAQNITPEQFSQFTSEYFTQNYGGGTGDPYHDNEMQAAWKAKTQEARHQNEIEIVKRIQQKRAKAAFDAVYSFGKDAKFTGENYYESLGLMSKANPSLTHGQVSAKVLGTWIDAAKQTKAGSQKLIAFLHRKDYDEDGVEIGSLAERFPAEMAQHEQNLTASYKKFVTLSGQKSVTAVSSAAVTAIGMPDGTMTDMKSKLKALLNVYTASGKLDNVPGASSTQTTKIRSDILGAIVKLQNTHKVTMKVAQNAVGSGNHHVTKEEYNDGAVRLLAEMNLDTEASATNIGKAARNLMDKHNNGVPAVVVEKLTAALSSGDSVKAKNALKAISIIDPTGSIMAKEFKDNPHATFLLHTKHANFDQAFAILHDDNFKAAAAELTLDKVVFGDTPLPTGSDAKQDIANQIESVLFGTTGDGTLSVGEQILGNNTIVSFFGAGDDVLYSPTLRNAMKSQAILIAAQHKYQTGTNIGPEKLRERLAATFRGKVVPLQSEDGDPMLDFEREVGTDITRSDVESNQPINTSDVTTENARYGIAVMTPWGETQNTVENMGEAVVDLVDNGLYGLQAGDLDDEDLAVRPHSGLRGKNAYVIMNLKTNQPLVLPIGKNIDGEERFDATGESQFFNPNKTFKLTGDPNVDKKMIKPFVHPSIALIPRREGDSKTGKVKFYELGIRPFFKDPPNQFLRQDDYKRMLKSKLSGLKRPPNPARFMRTMRQNIQRQNRILANKVKP